MSAIFSMAALIGSILDCVGREPDLSIVSPRCFIAETFLIPVAWTILLISSIWQFTLIILHFAKPSYSPETSL